MCSIPEVPEDTPHTIIAETGGDLPRFTNSGHPLNWIGVTPASYDFIDLLEALLAVEPV